MKTLKTTTVTHKKVEKVLELLRELHLEIEFMGDSFRITDLELCEKHPQLSNLILLDEEHQVATCLPPLAEHRLEIFE